MSKISKAIKKFADYLEEYDPFFDENDFSFPISQYENKREKIHEEPVVLNIDEDEDFPFD